MRVRPATPRDATAIARILAGSLGDKYGPAFGPHAERALGAIVRASRSRPPGGYRVAVDEDDRPVGVAHLGLTDEGAPVFGPVSREVGPLTALRATVVFLAFAKSGARPGDAHLDEVAVVPEARRRGVATALLEECRATATASGKRCLTLWVTGDNRAAQALYRGAGFTVRRRQRWLSGRLLFGSRGALLMERRLP